MRRILNTAHVYMILGVVSGLYYRELTKAEDFTGDSQLGVVHTHLLALGMLFFLVVLVLEKQFGLTGSRLFPWFYWIYNAGLALTVGMMTVHGTLTVLGRESGAAIAGIAASGTSCSPPPRAALRQPGQAPPGRLREGPGRRRGRAGRGRTGAAPGGLTAVPVERSGAGARPDAAPLAPSGPGQGPKTPTSYSE
ncbi:DUF2871 domain-containing protein [Kitasatospora arboriphila]